MLFKSAFLLITQKTKLYYYATLFFFLLILSIEESRT